MEALIERKKKKAQERRAAELLAEAQKVGGSDSPAVDQPEGLSFGRVPSPPPSVKAAGDTVLGSSEADFDPRKRPRP